MRIAPPGRRHRWGDWCCVAFLVMGLGRVELPTSRLSGVRSNHLSYRPYSPLVPLPLRPLLGPELVLVPIVELVVQVIVVVGVVAVLVVDLILVQIVVEVFVEFLILFEFSELLVDVVAPALERPIRRRLAGQR